MASESVVLDVLGYKEMASIKPGEAIYIEMSGRVHRKQCCSSPRYAPCIFEFVYLARPDSMIDGISVYKARLKMGEKLAIRFSDFILTRDIDVVIPIPDTSDHCSALPMAHRLNVKYRQGLIKNRYVGRTFIMPGQAERKRSVRRKLNTVELEFQRQKCVVG